MPPKPKRKRASFNNAVSVDASVEEKEVSTTIDEQVESPSVRQVVEVVEEESVPEAIETIKKDAQEIEDAVENLEDAVGMSSPEMGAPIRDHEEILEEKIEKEKSKDAVDSLFSSSTRDVRPEITVVGKKDKSLAIWVGAMLGIAVAVGVGLVFLVRGSSGLPALGSKPTPTVASTIAPSPTVGVTIARKDISVRVLNGGGVAGAATKMKTFLEGKGYTVDSTGNTKEYTYTSTVVQVKTGKDAIKTLLTDDLKGDYTLETSTESVASESAYDAIVIVGKE